MKNLFYLKMLLLLLFFISCGLPSYAVSVEGFNSDPVDTLLENVSSDNGTWTEEAGNTSVNKITDMYASSGEHSLFVVDTTTSRPNFNFELDSAVTEEFYSFDLYVAAWYEGSSDIRFGFNGLNAFEQPRVVAYFDISKATETTFSVTDRFDNEYAELDFDNWYRFYFQVNYMTDDTLITFENLDTGSTGTLFTYMTSGFDSVNKFYVNSTSDDNSVRLYLDDVSVGYLAPETPFKSFGGSVPEPSASLLFLLGIFGALIVSRKK